MSQFCRCSGESGVEGAWMRLVEAKRTMRVDRPRAVHELACEEIEPETAAAEEATSLHSRDGNGEAAALVRDEADGSPSGKSLGPELPREA